MIKTYIRNLSLIIL